MQDGNISRQIFISICPTFMATTSCQTIHFWALERKNMCENFINFSWWKKLDLVSIWSKIDVDILSDILSIVRTQIRLITKLEVRNSKRSQGTSPWNRNSKNSRIFRKISQKLIERLSPMPWSLKWHTNLPSTLKREPRFYLTELYWRWKVITDFVTIRRHNDKYITKPAKPQTPLLI